MKQSQKLSNKTIDPYFNEWHGLKIELQDAHQTRSKHAAGFLLQGTQLFNALLAECGGELYPLNCQDRLDFITTHSSTFAAFRQLDELFVEMKKTISSKRVQLNNKL